MCSPQDSPASRFRSLDSERERMMTATSGRRLSELYTKSSPLGLLERTLLESSRWFSPVRRLKWEAVPLCSEKVTEKEYCYGKNTSSKPSAVTLNEKVTKSGRLLFRLVPSERHTDGTGCGLLQGGLLQTPRATEIVEDPEKFVKRNGDRKPGCMPNLSSMAAYRADLLPTPMSTEVRHGQRVKELKEAGGQTFHSRENGETRPNGLMDYMDFHGMLSTPTARDHKNGSKPEDNRTKRKLQQGWTLELNDMATGGLLPTPNASEGEKYTKKYNPNSQMGKVLTAMAMNNMLPTPTASCHNTGTTANRKDGKSRESELNHFIARQVGQTSQLNPLFVQEMMGFPYLWTELPFQSGGRKP